MNQIKNIDVFLEVEVKDRNGRLIRRLKKKSESLLTNFMQMLTSAMVLEAYTLTDTGGNSRTVSLFVPNTSDTPVELTPMDVEAPDDNDNYGIQVGTGTAAVSPGDHALASKISHGTASGNMDYGACSLETTGVSDNTSYARYRRDFTNLSGAAITVNEIGMVAKYKRVIGATTEGEWYFL
ncbi:MAG: hypothetical protein DRP11_03440, partial [Candidatus Aenigmatarchaeota archaeon]